MFPVSRTVVSQVVFWPNFQRDFVGFWSGAGRFVLNSLDDGLRTNPGTSAREFISFCKIASLPDLSVGALTAPHCIQRGVYAQAFLSCAAQPRVYHWSVSRWLRSVQFQLPEGLPCNGCVLHLTLCSLAGFLYSRCSCVHLASFFFFSVLSPLVTASIHHAYWWSWLFKWKCYCVSGYKFLFSGMRWVWHLENYFLLLSSVSHDGLSGAAPLV